MGNTRSGEIQHERLQEKSEQYFKKVVARNKIKTRDMSIPSLATRVSSKKSKDSFRSPFKRGNSGSSKSSKSSKQKSSSVLSGHSSLDQNNSIANDSGYLGSHSYLSPDVNTARSRAAMLERSESPSLSSPLRHSQSQPDNLLSQVGSHPPINLNQQSSQDQSFQILQKPQPLHQSSNTISSTELNQMFKPPKRKTKLKSTSKNKKQSSRKTHKIDIPRPQGKGTGKKNSQKLSSSKTKVKTHKQSQKSHLDINGLISPDEALDGKTTSHGNGIHRNNSRYLPPSQKRAFKMQNENRAFEATLSYGMIWTEIPRRGSITCVSFAPLFPSEAAPSTVSTSTTSPCSSPTSSILTQSTLSEGLFPILAVGSEAGMVSIIRVGTNNQSLPPTLPPLQLSFDDPNDITNVASNTDNVENKNGNSNVSNFDQNMLIPKYAILTEIPREGKVRTLDWSPNGRYLAIGGNDCSAIIVNIQTLRVIQEIEREDRIYSVRWSPDGDILAIGGFDGMVAIMSFTCDDDDEGNGVCELITEIPRLGLVLALGWSANRQYLAVGGSDKRAAIIQVDNWEVVGEVQRPGSVQCLEWSPDGRILGIGGHDGVVAVVDIKTRTILKEIRRSRGGSSCRITDITWSPDGAFLTIAGTDKICAIYETQSFVMVHDINRNENVNCVDWQGGEGKYLAVGGDDENVAILKTGGMMNFEQDSTDSSANTSENESNPDDWSTASSSKQSSANWMDISEFDEESIRKEPDKTHVIRAMTFNHGSTLLAISGIKRNVSIIDTRTWSTIHEIPTKNTVQSISFSCSNGYLALGSDNSPTCIIGLPSFNLLTTLPSIGSIHCLSFSPDSSRLALGDADGMLTLISTSDWNILGEMDESESPIYTVDWSQDGEYFAIGRNNAICTVHHCADVYRNFWVSQADLIRKSAVNIVAFGADGNYLAVGGGDWTVGVYMKNQNWALTREFRMDGWILTLGWSFDSRFLAMGGTDLAKGGVVINTMTWEKVDEIEDKYSSNPSGVGIGEEVHCISWSDDGEYLAIAGSGGIAKIVDAKTWAVRQLINQNDEEFPNNTVDKHIRETLPPSVEESSCEEPTFLSHESPTELLLAGNINDDITPRSELSSTIKKIQKKGYSSRSEPAKFLSICNVFLPQYDYDKSSHVLSLFFPSILNMKEHVIHLNSMTTTTLESISTQKNGEPLISFCRLLRNATLIMEEILEDEDEIDNWWNSKEKYDLDVEEVENLERWNAFWEKIDRTCPPINIELLSQVNHLEDKSFEDTRGYRSIGDTDDDWKSKDTVRGDEKSLGYVYGSDTDASSSSWSSRDER